MSEQVQQPAAVPDDLLRTKLAPPRLDTATVPRGALLARIDAGLSRKLTLISAPAGFGKTTLLAEWLHDFRFRIVDFGSDLVHEQRSIQNPKSQIQNPQVAWVSLDASDNDPVRFWRYLLSACRAWDQAIGRASLAALRMARQPALDALLIPFINELAQLHGRHILVIEDYHTITAAEVHASLAFLIEHLPGDVHLILTSRSTPDLPLARLRARNELTELTAEDLRFSRAEIQAFLERTLHIALAPELLGRLEQRTEGWVAGLRLMALALQHKNETPAIEQFLATFSGGHRHVVEYLISEVLAAQPELLQTFLLSSCFLARLTAPLCDAIMGRSDSAQLLEKLERENLFVVPLDAADRQMWYRYHPLFAEALQQYARQRLGEAHVRTLHERACAWYEAHGMLHEAVEEAIAAGQTQRAAQLIEGLFDRGGLNELYTLIRWIEQLPRATLQGHPLLCLAYAAALLFTGDRFAPATAQLVEQWAQMAEAAWLREEDEPRLGQVAALRAMVAFWQNDIPRTFAQARQALELLDEHDLQYRSVSLLYGAQEHLFAGRTGAAQRLLMESYTLFEIIRNVHGRQAAMMGMGDLCLLQADLEQAGHYYQQVLDAAVGGEEMLDDQSYAMSGLGAVAYERDELEQAEQQALRARELAVLRGSEMLQARSVLLLCLVWQARGQAAQALHELQALIAQTRSALLLRELHMARARLALAMGDIEDARRWHAAVRAQGAPALRLQAEREALTLARLRLAQGDPQGALKLLDTWRADAVANERTRSEIEILALQALAHSALGDQAGAAQALISALALGQPRGLLRVFLDLGQPLARLIQAAAPDLTRRSLAAYAATLLRALTAEQTAAPGVALPLLEPLSPQEQRVLRMIVAGLTNPEIARELVVSANTVKTHIKNIYRKLNVGTREEAQAAARELHLY